MQINMFVAAAALVGISACSSTGSIQSKNPDEKISGKVTRGFVEPHEVEVTMDGKTYRGEWRTGAPTAAQTASTSYPHRYHIGQVSSVLVADDGSKLDCRWQTHSLVGEGACKTGNHEIPLILK
jgi:hypothetical protein